jgi:hypothetical protein
MRFKEWIESKTLYHGTSYEFKSFNLQHAGERDFGDNGFGIYLTSNPRLAQIYAYESARNSGREPVVLVIKHTLKNIADLSDQKLLNQITQETGAPFPKKLDLISGKQTRSHEESMAITRYLTKLGYDGAKKGSEVVAYDPAKLEIIRKVPAEDADVLSNLA